MTSSHQTALDNAGVLRPLLASDGWALVTRELDDELANLTKAVMEDWEQGPERDKLIDRYRTVKACRDKPQQIYAAAMSVIEAEAEGRDHE